MPKGPLRFRQSDLERALRAVKRVGIEGATVTVTATGDIKVTLTQTGEASAAGASEWDQVETI